MELTEKNGQPSMEEILASIRRIIAEEPDSGTNRLIDLSSSRPALHGDGALDEPADFELPSIFRAPQNPAADRPTPLFNRLTEAIRSASQNGGGGNAVTAGRSAGSEPALSSLRLARAEAAEEPSAGAQGSSAFQLSVFHEAAGGHRTEDAAPVAQAAAPVAIEQPETAAPVQGGAPQVPRRMAAFKDTRFVQMSQPAPVVPEPAASTPFPMPAEPPVEQAYGANHLDAIPEDDTASAPVMAPSYPLGQIRAEHLNETQQALQALLEPQEPEPQQDATEAIPAVPAAPLAAPPIPDAFSNAPIEDATADLLRPMLRQWLAENMPRMVEKALHIEVAESFGTPKKPGGQG